MPKVTQLFAFVLADTGPDDEGVPAASGKLNGQEYMFPLMGAESERAEQLEVIAQSFSDFYGKRLELRVFTEMRVLKVIEPKSRRATA